MRLQRLQVCNYKNLKDIEISFSESEGKTLVVGNNGSGKSNLLEVFSAIFSALYTQETNVNPSFDFELEYIFENPPAQIDGNPVSDRVLIKVCNPDGIIKVSYHDFTTGYDHEVTSFENYKDLLPQHVIAVYSGEEQRLWEDYYFKAYDNYNKQYMSGSTVYQSQKMIYLNHYYWNLIASILIIHDIEDYSKFVKTDIGLKDPYAIYCRFDVNKLKRNLNKRAQQLLKILNPEDKEALNIDFETYRRAKEYCGYEADLFYNMLVLTLYKEFKIITDFKIKCRDNIEIKNLSEGEKKLLLIYGAINILSGENLYLLDEPDAHLHEGRKREIYDLICQDKTSQFVISSHSPTLTKLFNYSHVILLENENESCNVTYGDVAKTISSLTNGEWSYVDHTIFFDRARPLLLVEGEGDVKYIRKSIELLSETEQRYKQLINMDIIHCGGALNVKHTLDELLPCIPEGKQVIVVFDRDEAGGNGMKQVIKKGKNREDYKTYKHGNYYYLKLPKTPGYEKADFVIEDYFSKETKMSIAQGFLDATDGTFNAFPNNLKEQIKKKLSDDIENHTAETMNGFSILLDKLCKIIAGTEECVEV